MERLQRILAHAGVASRRAAEEMIRAGRVTVNGQVVTEMGAKADPARSTIRVDGTPIRRQQLRYILLNKPRGYITTTSDERDRWTVLDLVQVKQRVYPVGRLDRITEGLLLLTNDGEIANRVMHPRFGLAKEYHVLTTQRPSDVTLQRLRNGISLDGKLIVPDEVRLLREERDGIWLRVDLHEGMTHVVRRMMEAAGIPVERLRRVRIGPLTVSGIPLGAWRDLTPGELAGLIEALKLDRPPTAQDHAPRYAKTIHVQRPRPRRTSAPATPPATPEPAHRQPGTTPISATGRSGRGRAAAEARTRPDQATEATPPIERRPLKSRRRRGEPPAPVPKPKKAASRRDQRKGRTARGPNDTRSSPSRPTRSDRRRTPDHAADAARPRQPKQQRQSSAPTNETRSGYDDPSRRRNRRARARDEAKSVSRRDRD